MQWLCGSEEKWGQNGPPVGDQSDPLIQAGRGKRVLEPGIKLHQPPLLLAASWDLGILGPTSESIEAAAGGGLFGWLHKAFLPAPPTRQLPHLLAKKLSRSGLDLARSRAVTWQFDELMARSSSFLAAEEVDS